MGRHLYLKGLGVVETSHLGERRLGPINPNSPAEISTEFAAQNCRENSVLMKRLN